MGDYGQGPIQQNPQTEHYAFGVRNRPPFGELDDNVCVTDWTIGSDLSQSVVLETTGNFEYFYKTLLGTITQNRYNANDEVVFQSTYYFYSLVHKFSITMGGLGVRLAADPASRTLTVGMRHDILFYRVDRVGPFYGAGLPAIKSDLMHATDPVFGLFETAAPAGSNLHFWDYAGVSVPLNIPPAAGDTFAAADSVRSRTVNALVELPSPCRDASGAFNPTSIVNANRWRIEKTDALTGSRADLSVPGLTDDDFSATVTLP